MEYIYAVTAGAYSDYHIVALCSDRNKAEKICEVYNRSYTFGGWGEASVKEYRDGSRIDLDRPVFEVSIYGDLYEAKELSGEDKIEAVYENWHPFNLIYTNNGTFFFLDIYADSKEQAIKIAQDKYAEYSARKAGI